MAKQHPIHLIAAELQQEVTDNAREVAASMAPPDQAHDAVKLQRGQAIDMVRRMSVADPTYLAKRLDQMAPVAATLPGGTKLRPAAGVKAFHDLVKEARPDIYAAITGDLRPMDRAVAQEVP